MNEIEQLKAKIADDGMGQFGPSTVDVSRLNGLYETEIGRLREIELSARNLLERADGHYMNADDMYCLQIALGYGDEEMSLNEQTEKGN